MHHFGDPCVHCSIGHDDVPAGPCQGDPTKAVPIAFRSMETRHDGVTRYLIKLSSGQVIEHHSHAGEHAPYTHWGRFDELRQPPRYDPQLTR